MCQVCKGDMVGSGGEASWPKLKRGKIFFNSHFFVETSLQVVVEPPQRRRHPLKLLLVRLQALEHAHLFDTKKINNIRIFLIK